MIKNNWKGKRSNDCEVLLIGKTAINSFQLLKKRLKTVVTHYVTALITFRVSLVLCLERCQLSLTTSNCVLYSCSNPTHVTRSAMLATSDVSQPTKATFLWPSRAMSRSLQFWHCTTWDWIVRLDIMSKHSCSADLSSLITFTCQFKMHRHSLDFSTTRRCEPC